MNELFCLNKDLSLEHSDVICLGSKTRLCNNLFNQLKKNSSKCDFPVSIKNYIDSKDFLNNKNSYKDFKFKKAIIFLCASGGVQAINHDNNRALKSLDEDLQLIKYFNQNWNEVYIVFVSSVLGICSSKKNIIYSSSKLVAEKKLSILVSECKRIKNFSVLYPGRIIDKWFRFFISGSITYSRLSDIIINFNRRKNFYNYFLIE